LALDLQVVVDQRGGCELAHLADVDCDVSEDNVIFAYHGGSIPMPGDDPYFARLIGKRVILPQPPEFSDVWPYEKPRQFESFIIGTDDDGNPIAHTCDPKALANNFGANAGAPSYLTPVFFERNVLDKYYGDSDRYRVEDGYLRETSTWGLRMDNALEDRVAVFLGDLGSDIPYREQQYWKSFNVPPSGTMSKTAIRRSFLGQFAASERVEHRFVNAYKRLTDAWAEEYGWPLYKELHEGDAHIINSIHVPTNPSFGQFDDQIVRLAKLVVDSLNEESIVLATGSRGKSEKGIAKLQRLLDEKGISDTLCAELARVQGARTRSAAHRKGSDFNLPVLLDGNADLPTLFNDLLERLIVAFDQLSTAIGVVEPE
jgi:sulfur relay (sulfurtransferase) DsrC/TusE family protein